METNNENRYYHGSFGSGNRHESDKRNQLNDGDYGKEYEARYKGHDGRNRLDYDSYNRGEDRSFYGKSMLKPGESRSRRGYGVEDNVRGGSGYDADRNGNDRKISDRNEGGYGSGRTGGYSGAAFGGSNYSSHGSFGGDSSYGSMSGGGGNMGPFASKSGYGNPNVNSDRGVPNYGINRETTDSASNNTYRGQNYGSANSVEKGGNTWEANNYNSASGGNQNGYGSMGSNTASGNNTYKGYGSNNNRSGSGYTQRKSDRGGYTDYDPNNRWNS